MRRHGLGGVKHHVSITKAAMAKLYSGETHVFDVEAPCCLLNKVWFEVMFYLCRRGQENLRSLTKINEPDKNHRVSLQEA